MVRPTNVLFLNIMKCLFYRLVIKWFIDWQIKQIMQANCKVTTEADPVWYLKWVLMFIKDSYIQIRDLQT